VDSSQGTEDLVLQALHFHKMDFHNKFLGGGGFKLLHELFSYILKAVASILSVCNFHVVILSSVSRTVRRFKLASTSNAACNFDSCLFYFEDA